MDQAFYKWKSWGASAIKEAKDLPTLKLNYLLRALAHKDRGSATVLEIGCGSGKMLASMKKHYPGLHLAGIDMSEEQIRLARDKTPDVEFICGDGERLPFKDDSFDFTVFCDYLEHVEHPIQAMAEIYRVLKPGGIFHGYIPAENEGVYRLSKKVFGRHFKEKTGGHIQQFSLDKIDDMIVRAGFVITEKKYSYHLLGSIMDYTLFAMLLNRRLAELFWAKNKYYRDPETHPSLSSRILNFTMGFGNLIAYEESAFLQNTKFSATAVHITARKNKS
jgi:ubiquinone/menaquinone biosynthesis C-methylase UbiE